MVNCTNIQKVCNEIIRLHGAATISLASGDAEKSGRNQPLAPSTGNIKSDEENYCLLNHV